MFTSCIAPSAVCTSEIASWALRWACEMLEIWARSFNNIDPRIRWVITEEGDQLWHAKGKWLQNNWLEVASAKGQVTGIVHLYRRPD